MQQQSNKKNCEMWYADMHLKSNTRKPRHQNHRITSGCGLVVPPQSPSFDCNSHNMNLTVTLPYAEVSCYKISTLASLVSIWFVTTLEVGCSCDQWSPISNRSNVRAATNRERPLSVEIFK